MCGLVSGTDLASPRFANFMQQPRRRLPCSTEIPDPLAQAPLAIVDLFSEVFAGNSSSSRLIPSQKNLFEDVMVSAWRYAVASGGYMRKSCSLTDNNCLQAQFGEQGELLVRIDDADALTFDGYYKNEQATKKKILNNVFQKGDAYFRSGDLLRLDEDGFFFFGDRVGDTFRWKSENVATTEVAQVVGLYPAIAEANVYGTLVPNHDGRAGMAAVVVKQDQTLDFKDLYQYMRKKLPRYAIPLFIRFVPSMELTGTFKQQKVVFRNQGIDLSKIPKSDPVFWLKGDTYVPFTPQDLADIEAGKVRL